MSEDTVKIGIVTAEESGDLLAAEFIKALSLSNKKVQIYGLVLSLIHISEPTRR